MILGVSFFEQKKKFFPAVSPRKVKDFYDVSFRWLAFDNSLSLKMFTTGLTCFVSSFFFLFFLLPHC